METVLKLTVLTVVSVSLTTPPAHMLIGKLSLLLLHGGALFTSVYGRLMMGLVWTLLISVDWVAGVFCIIGLLLYLNSTLKWMQKMIWYDNFSFYS